MMGLQKSVIPYPTEGVEKLTVCAKCKHYDNRGYCTASPDIFDCERGETLYKYASYVNDGKCEKFEEGEHWTRAPYKPEPKPEPKKHWFWRLFPDSIPR